MKSATRKNLKKDKNAKKSVVNASFPKEDAIFYKEVKKMVDQCNRGKWLTFDSVEELIRWQDSL